MGEKSSGAGTVAKEVNKAESGELWAKADPAEMKAVAIMMKVGIGFRYIVDRTVMLAGSAKSLELTLSIVDNICK